MGGYLDMLEICLFKWRSERKRKRKRSSLLWSERDVLSGVESLLPQLSCNRFDEE